MTSDQCLYQNNWYIMNTVCYLLHQFITMKKLIIVTIYSMESMIVLEKINFELLWLKNIDMFTHKLGAPVLFNNYS